MAAHQAPPSLGFSRQEHWSGLPFPSPMHESEKWKWSHSVVSDSSRPHGLQSTRLFHPRDFPGKSTGLGCHCLFQKNLIDTSPKKLYRWQISIWKGALHLIVNRKMQIKRIIRYYYAPIRMAKIWNTDNLTCWWGHGATGTLIYC